MEIRGKLLDIVRDAERRAIPSAILNKRWEFRELARKRQLSGIGKKTQVVRVTNGLFSNFIHTELTCLVQRNTGATTKNGANARMGVLYVIHGI